MSSQQKIQSYILLTVVADNTALEGMSVEDAAGIPGKNRIIQKPLVGKFRGEWLKEMENGTAARFKTAADAVNCAVQIQKAVNDLNSFSLQIAIIAGDSDAAQGDVEGAVLDGLVSLAKFSPEGGICITGPVHDEVKVGCEFSFSSLGKKVLKGESEEQEIFVLEKEEISAGQNQAGMNDPAESGMDTETSSDDGPGDALGRFRYHLLNGELEDAADVMAKYGLQEKDVKSIAEEAFDTHRMSGTSMLAIEIAEKFKLARDAVRSVCVEAWTRLGREGKHEEAAHFALEKGLSEVEIERSAKTAYEQYLRENKIDKAIKVFDEFNLNKDEMLTINIAEFNRAYEKHHYYQAARIGSRFNLSHSRTLSAGAKAAIDAVKNNETDRVASIVVGLNMLNNDSAAECPPNEYSAFLRVLDMEFIKEALANKKFRIVQDFLEQTKVLFEKYSHKSLTDFREAVLQTAIREHNRFLAAEEEKSAKFIKDMYELITISMPDVLRSVFVAACEKYHLSLLRNDDLHAAVAFKKEYLLTDMNLSKESHETILKQAAVFITGALKRSDFTAAKEARKEYYIEKDLFNSAAATAIIYLIDQKLYDEAFAVNKEFKFERSDKVIQSKIRNKFEELMEEGQFLIAAELAASFRLEQEYRDRSAYKAWEYAFRLKKFDAAWDIHTKLKVPKDLQMRLATDTYWKVLEKGDTQTAVYIRKTYRIRLSVWQWLQEFFRTFFTKK